MRPSRWRGRPVRVCRYDALHHDGRVETDVRLTVMYRRSPADFETVSRIVHRECPEIGTGAWVHGAGHVIEGPGPVEREGARARNGRRVPWPPQETRADPRRTALWRAVLGALAVVVGILLVTGPGDDGPLGPLGAVSVLCGIAAVATSLPGGTRRR